MVIYSLIGIRNVFGSHKEVLYGFRQNKIYVHLFYMSERKIFGNRTVNIISFLYCLYDYRTYGQSSVKWTYTNFNSMLFKVVVGQKYTLC